MRSGGEEIRLVAGGEIARNRDTRRDDDTCNHRTQNADFHADT
jgi:hypothetical protein